MKKIIFALTLCLMFSNIAKADDVVFSDVNQIQKIDLVPVETTATRTTTKPALKPLSTGIQEQSYKDAITNLDEASAEIREHLIDYTTQLSAAELRVDQAQDEVKQLKKYVSETKKKLKNIEKSKKYIHSNIEEKKEAI